MINPDYRPDRAHLPSVEDLARWKACGRAKWKSEQATRDRIAARIARAQSVATSQGAQWAHSPFTGEERRFRKGESTPIGWSAGRAAKATGDAK